MLLTFELIEFSTQKCQLVVSKNISAENVCPSLQWSNCLTFWQKELLFSALSKLFVFTICLIHSVATFFRNYFSARMYFLVHFWRAWLDLWTSFMSIVNCVCTSAFNSVCSLFICSAAPKKTYVPILSSAQLNICQNEECEIGSKREKERDIESRQWCDEAKMRTFIEVYYVLFLMFFFLLYCVLVSDFHVTHRNKYDFFSVLCSVGNRRRLPKLRKINYAEQRNTHTENTSTNTHNTEANHIFVKETIQLLKIGK